MESQDPDGTLSLFTCLGAAVLSAFLSGVLTALLALLQVFLLSARWASMFGWMLPVPLAGIVGIAVAKAITDHTISRGARAAVRFATTVGVAFGAVGLAVAPYLTIGRLEALGSSGADKARQWSLSAEALDLVAAATIALPLAVGIGTLTGGLTVRLMRTRRSTLRKWMRAAAVLATGVLGALLLLGIVRRIQVAGIEDRLGSLVWVGEVLAPGSVVSEMNLPVPPPMASPTRTLIVPGPLGERVDAVQDVIVQRECAEAGCLLYLRQNDLGADVLGFSASPVPMQRWGDKVTIYREPATQLLFVDIGSATTRAFDARRGGWLPDSTRSVLAQNTAPPRSWLITAGVGALVVGWFWASSARLRQRVDLASLEGCAQQGSPLTLATMDAAIVALALVSAAPLLAAAAAGLVL
ncbi:MAG: hypothetical protein IPK82_43980 [Polyangiaceae bacterium]|nr:hypothetical protein [Polyangiaceae bacterium]